LAGLVLEVKGDFCHKIKEILATHLRRDDYIERGFDSPYRYNPLHNDLYAYALAYSIQTVYFGRARNLSGSRRTPTSSNSSTFSTKSPMTT
jgi:hypothetical protein